MAHNLPPLTADSGELRLARRVASYVYGRREVVWPEDVDDPEDDLPDGREFGWVAKLDGPEPGLSERRFVRGDVSIDAVEEFSDVEQVLDDSAIRAGGEVYFESVIEGDGLGRLVPGVDFDEGELVDVRFWGRVLDGQLVTSIDWNDGVPSVALGGQSIRDSDSLARARAELVRLINGERRDRADEVGRVDRKASAAQYDAGELREALAGEGASISDVHAHLEELNQQLQEAGETEESLALIPAYIAANTQRWALQVQVDALQDAMMEELAEQQVQTKQELENLRAQSTNRVIATQAGSSNPNYPVQQLSGGRWGLLIENVRGAMFLVDKWDIQGDQRVNPRQEHFTALLDIASVQADGDQMLVAEWVVIPGVVRAINHVDTNFRRAPDRTWHELTASVPEIMVGASGTDDFDLSVSVRFVRAWGWYRVQIRADGEVIGDKQAQGSSTLTNAVAMTVTASTSQKKLAPDTKVTVHIYRWDNGIHGDRDAYNRVTTRGSWTEKIEGA